MYGASITILKPRTDDNAAMGDKITIIAKIRILVVIITLLLIAIIVTIIVTIILMVITIVV